MKQDVFGVEISENMFWLCVVIVIMLGLTTIAVSVSKTQRASTQAYLDAGCVQKQKIGAAGTFWHCEGNKTE